MADYTVSMSPVQRGAPASSCVACGECLAKCPQHLDIPNFLARVKETRGVILVRLRVFAYLCSQNSYNMKTSITIRQEMPHDHDAVYELIREAFATVEESDHDEQDLVERLRHSLSFIPELSLVAETGQGELVGHILLTRIRIINGARAFHSLAVAPLSVLPLWQRQGIGSALIREAHRLAAALGYGSVVLLWHPGYYTRFGYLPARRFDSSIPIEAPDNCCMVIELLPGGLKGVQGKVEYDPAFGLNSFDGQPVLL